MYVVPPCKRRHHSSDIMAQQPTGINAVEPSLIIPNNIIRFLLAELFLSLHRFQHIG